MANVAVLGAGIMGLSSAVAIQKALPEAKVTLMADKFTVDTTSDGAGGLFVPSADQTDKNLVRKWGKEGARHFFDLAFSEHSQESGVCLSHGYELFSKPHTEMPIWFEFALSYRKMDDREMSKFRPHYVEGYHYVTVVIEGRKYLPWLTARFTENGGTVQNRKINSFDKLAGQYDVIVNCTGLGSRTLADDKSLRPLRGHVIRVSAPWIKYFLHADDGFYFIPSAENATIGGTKVPDRYDVTPDPADTKALWDRAVTRMPTIKGAKQLWEWVGLRPYRPSPRVEPELKTTAGGRKMKIVHNYGHGTTGISLSWGTGVHVAEMVKDLLNANSRL